MFCGSYTALITPMKGEEVDEEAVAGLVSWQLDQGTHGLVPVGTTGEAPTLNAEERFRIIELCSRIADGRVPVIAGVGSADTEATIRFARQARDAGASALLITCPYYNRPSQEGLYRHFKKIHDAIDLPQFIYNVPGRSAVDISVETVARLSLLPNIVGIKDATGDLERVSLQRACAGSDFIQFSGDDGTALAFRAHGGHGCISVTANVAPALCARFQEACSKKDWDTALSLHDLLVPLHRALFVETNPVPAKYAASLLSLCRNEVRLPLVAASVSMDPVRDAMVSVGILSG